MLTTVMYHYVRDLGNSRYPEIKGLDIALFRGQLDYIEKHYEVIPAEALLDSIINGTPLPENALLLTFDDGYADHFEFVYPELSRRAMKGLFFPPGRCIEEHKVLDVNKIHFILAATSERAQLVDELRECVEQHATTPGVRGFNDYWEKLAIPGRYDPPETVFIKRMLQRELPGPLRAAVTDRLFKQWVSEDETTFARELYLSSKQLSQMIDDGHYVGSHGYDHFWMNSESLAIQERDVKDSLAFLDRIGAPTTDWIMCYPYGAYDETLLEVCTRLGCVAGITTEVGLSSLPLEAAMAMPRINTNDLPSDGNADIGIWTERQFSQS